MKFRNDGFTLVELMVALTLLGVVATLLASGTRLCLDISTRGNARAEFDRLEELGRTLLRRQLQGALPLRYWTTTDDRRVEHLAFEGEKDRMRFVSRESISEGSASLPRWVELHWQIGDANKGGSLIGEERRILSPDNQPAEISTARAEILHCVEFRFEYLQQSAEKSEWYARWDVTERQSSLPDAVRVQCKTKDGTMKFLIPLDYAESARQGMVMQ